MKKTKAPGEKAIRDLLEKHGCPLPFHEVRTRFLGAIASLDPSATPLAAVAGLWGGALPGFDNEAEAEALIGALTLGLWNDLTRHQESGRPFRLTRLPTEPTTANFEKYARTRLEELSGFMEGLFNGAKAIDLPETAHVAVGYLYELRNMMAGFRELAVREAEAGNDDRAGLEGMFERLREATRIMEIEIHAAVISCTRARRLGLESAFAERPTVH